jgi:hypothetical protein
MHRNRPNLFRLLLKDEKEAANNDHKQQAEAGTGHHRSLRLLARCTAQRKSLPALGGFRSHLRLGCALRPPNAKCPAKNDEDNDDKDEDQTTEHGWGYPLRTR